MLNKRLLYKKRAASFEASHRLIARPKTVW